MTVATGHVVNIIATIRASEATAIRIFFLFIESLLPWFSGKRKSAGTADA
jgi:hypothetical protein